MVNQVTGERFVWRHTAESTGGEFAEFDLHLSVGAIVAAPHVHPRQRENFRVESGDVMLAIGVPPSGSPRDESGAYQRECPTAGVTLGMTTPTLRFLDAGLGHRALLRDVLWTGKGRQDRQERAAA
jgi:hypothetical protein